MTPPHLDVGVPERGVIISISRAGTGPGGTARSSPVAEFTVYERV